MEGGRQRMMNEWRKRERRATDPGRKIEGFISLANKERETEKRKEGG